MKPKCKPRRLREIERELEALGKLWSAAPKVTLNGVIHGIAGASNRGLGLAQQKLALDNAKWLLDYIAKLEGRRK